MLQKGIWDWVDEVQVSRIHQVSRSIDVGPQLQAPYEISAKPIPPEKEKLLVQVGVKRTLRDKTRAVATRITCHPRAPQPRRVVRSSNSRMSIPSRALSSASHPRSRTPSSIPTFDFESDFRTTGSRNRNIKTIQSLEIIIIAGATTDRTKSRCPQVQEPSGLSLVLQAIQLNARSPPSSTRHLPRAAPMLTQITLPLLRRPHR